jgi:HPt (histidine-containing phosphotransfer) domain-containing protein
VLDLKALEQIRALEQPGEPSLLAEMVETFRGSSLGYLARLDQALAAGDAEATADAAHALKGAAAALGAQQVRAVAAELESGGRKRYLAGAEHHLARLKAARAQALQHLSTLLPNAA